MTVGFDDREGFLMLDSVDDEIRYSLGDPQREDTKVFLLPQWTELSGKYMVPTDKLLDSVQTWATRGELSRSIDWTTEIY